MAHINILYIFNTIEFGILKTLTNVRFTKLTISQK